MRCRTSLSHAKGLDVVELCSGDEGADGCPSDAAAVRAREQMVFASERDGPDGPLDRVVVKFDAAVIEESGDGCDQHCAASQAVTQLKIVLLKIPQVPAKCGLL
jgi:hypothetical protein